MTAEKFMECFRGLATAHGCFLPQADGEGVKQKGKAFTKREPVTAELWEKHLAGVTGIGIVPIDENNQCHFGAIDIDQYPIDLEKIAKSVAAFPVIVCRSKSGGAHIYLFTKQPVSAKLMRAKLQELAAAMGHGDAETFPKQTVVLAEKGDVGNWINMPYFGRELSTRYAFGKTGQALSPDEFLALADTMRLTETELRALSFTLVTDDKMLGAPPCLRHLTDQGFPEGSRNEGLFNVAVYLRLRFPDDWQKLLDEYNHQYMHPPLDLSEVNNVVQSVDKKGYVYTCNRPSIKAHCNRARCLKEQFGVDKAQGHEELGYLTKVLTDPPTWFLNVGDKRMELTTEDLQSQLRFQRRCMEVLNTVPKKRATDAWEATVRDLLDNAQQVEVPADSSDDAQIVEAVNTFCFWLSGSSSQDSLRRGKPWANEEDNRVYFRLSSLLASIKKQQLLQVKPPKVVAVLKSMPGSKHEEIDGLSLWSLPNIGKTQPLPVPDGLYNQEF